jgi:hypothetical protein
VRLMLLVRGMMLRKVVAVVVWWGELKTLASGVLRLRELVNKAARERILADIKPVVRGRGWDMYRSINLEVRGICFQMPADDLTNVMDARGGLFLLEMAASPSLQSIAVNVRERLEVSPKPLITSSLADLTNIDSWISHQSTNLLYRHAIISAS